MDTTRLRLRIVIYLTALWACHTIAAYAGTQFDEAKRVVLPSENAKTILQWYAPDQQWHLNDWTVTTADLDRLECSLENALAKAKVGNASRKTWNFYRQYMPARWMGLRLIVVNGFYETAADLFPDKGIDPDQWKRQLMIGFGGGCMEWRAVYVVERDSFMTLRGQGHRGNVICNGPK